MVQDGIEAELQRVIASILSGDGFSFDVPSRSASNQMYIEALDRIALQAKASRRRCFVHAIGQPRAFGLCHSMHLIS